MRQGEVPFRRRVMLPVAVVIGVVALVLIGGTSAVAATTYPVTKEADTDDGTCDVDCSLREAITAANTTIGGATVSVPAGTYTLTVNTVSTQDDANAEGDLDITGDVTISGAGPGQAIIDGNGSVLHDHVIEVFTDASITGVTVTHGQSTNEDSGRDDGGGIHIDDLGSLDLSNAVLTDNHASTSAGYGGGLDVDGDATVSNVTISGNTALGGGGGVEVEGTGDFTNVTVSGNSAAQDGGGIAVFGGPVTLNNVTIAGNTADSSATDSGNGGGLFLNSDTTLANTIIAGNADASGLGGTVAPDCMNDGGPLTSMGHNLVQATPGGCDFSATGDITGVNPQLGALAANGSALPTRALASGSPAVNAGDPAAPGSAFPACAGTDERGVSRPQSGRCDIGAFELQPSPPSPPPPPSPAPSPSPQPSPPSCQGKEATIVGTAGADSLKGTANADVIVALGGNDKVSALGGGDTVCAGDGKDTVAGGGGKDHLNGENGKDVLRGNAGNDVLKGGKGKDTLIGGGGRDRLNGGAGKDAQRQ